MTTTKIRLAAASEVARMLGVGTARVHAIVADDPTFPEPVDKLSVGKIWLRDDVETWIRRYRTGRTVPRQTTS